METVSNGVKYIFFWNGIFSNWHPSVFVLDGIKYNCGEQYMMYMKAITFNDVDTASKILQEKSPGDQKSLGREVKNYNDKLWSTFRYDIVKKGLREKFNQNPKLKEYLLKYTGYQIVEASPYDRIWGIGFDEYEALPNISRWGENLLGKVLMDLCEEFNNDKH